MGFLDFFKTKGAQHQKQRTSTQNALNRTLFMPYGSGMPFTMDDNLETYVKDGYQGNANVYSVVNLITRSASVVNWGVYRVTDSKAHHYYKNYSGQHRVNSQRQTKQARNQALELAEQSDLAGLLECPNPHQGGGEFMENFLGFKLVTGNSYIHGIEVNDKFGELWVMPAHLTEIISSGKTFENVIEGYRIRDYMYKITLPKEEVMHGKYWNPDYSAVGSHLYGMSPLEAARGVVGQSNNSYEANQRALQNMGAEGMLTLDDNNITKQQADQLRKDLKKRGAGPENYKKILVNTAKWRWERFGISPTDLNLIESQKMSLRDIANIYGVSTQLLNDPDANTRANKKEARKALYYEVVLPELDNVRDEFNRWLASDHSEADGVEYFIDYEVNDIPALANDMGDVADKLSNAWWLTPDEKREEMGYDPIGEDEIYIPTNLMPSEGMDLQEEMKRYAAKNNNGTHA